MFARLASLVRGVKSDCTPMSLIKFCANFRDMVDKLKRSHIGDKRD